MKLNKLDLWAIICGSIVAYLLIFKVGGNIVAEWNDVDDYRITIIDKKPGVVAWTTTEGSGKHSKSVHNDAAAIWIKAQRVGTEYTCMWAERNPFHAEGYKIGGTYHGRYIEACNEDLTPNGDAAGFALLLVAMMICVFFMGTPFLSD